MTPPRLLPALAYARTVATVWILLPLAALSLPVWDWPIPSFPALYAVIGVFTACFWLGCFLASALLEALPPGVAADHHTYRGTNAILVLVAILNLATLFSRASFNPFTCADLLACTNDAYQAYVAGAGSGADSGFEYLRIALSPLIYGALAFSLWGSIGKSSRSTRALQWAVIGSEVLVAVATGTSRNIGNVLLFAVFIAGVRRRASGDAAKPRSVWMYIGGAIALIAFLSYFAFTQLNREGAVAAVGLLPFNGGFIEALSYTSDNDSVLLKAVESITRYLASGYFCLAMALDLKVGLTFPFGSSMFLARRAITATGDDGYVTLSLPGQMESIYRWSYSQQWQSIFTWLLSDYGYVGTGIVMIGIGFFFIATLGVALTSNSLISKLGAMIGFIMVVYIPANNQVFQTPETFAAFVFGAAVLFYTLLNRRHTPTRG